MSTELDLTYTPAATLAESNNDLATAALLLVNCAATARRLNGEARDPAAREALLLRLERGCAELPELIFEIEAIDPPEPEPIPTEPEAQPINPS